MARDSDRVPFGTGKGMQIIADNLLQKDFYHPQIFHDLHTWINVLNTASDADLCARLEELPQLSNLGKLHKLLRQSAKGSAYKRRHEWFDAFRTLKMGALHARHQVGNTSLRASD